MDYLPDIISQLSHQELFTAFKVQLKKDFDQSNFSSDFVAALESDYQRIQQKIAVELQRHEGRADFKIMNLLNRVDISEVQMTRYLNESSDEDRFKVIAELIIKRVLQKVVIKHYYKAKDNP